MSFQMPLTLMGRPRRRPEHLVSSYRMLSCDDVLVSYAARINGRLL